MAKIHPTSVVMDGAVLDDSVEVGPLCYVGPHVKIGAGTKLIAQCNVNGYTTIGKNNTIYPFASVGQLAQDLSADPDAVSYLKIGDGNTFRECCTIHLGTEPESSTVIGNNNLFMACSHIAHNCTVGNHVILVNTASVAGHSTIFDHAILSGGVMVHQFCRVGRFAIISGVSAFSKDVPPFMMAEGRNGGVKMINKVGLQRAGFDAETITVIKHIFRIYYREGLIPARAIEKIKAELPDVPVVREFLDFCATSQRGVITTPPAGHRD